MAGSIGSRERVAEYGGDSTDDPLGFQETVYIVRLVDIHVHIPYVGGETRNVLGDHGGDLLARSAPFGGEADDNMFASGEDSGCIGDKLYELVTTSDGDGDQGHRLI